jgi:hypothetical protein
MGELLIPGRDHGATDDIAQRMERLDRLAMPGEAGGGSPDLPKDPWQPRWRLDNKYVEFECGCRAIRCPRSAVPLKNFDPIIFRDLPQQAVYDFVCHRHGPGMNVYVHFGRFVTFDQWKKARQHLILGRTR